MGVGAPASPISGTATQGVCVTLAIRFPFEKLHAPSWDPGRVSAAWKVGVLPCLTSGSLGCIVDAVCARMTVWRAGVLSLSA
jgi:hypothetical protein